MKIFGRGQDKEDIDIKTEEKLSARPKILYTIHRSEPPPAVNPKLQVQVGGLPLQLDVKSIQSAYLYAWHHIHRVQLPRQICVPLHITRSASGS